MTTQAGRENKERDFPAFRDGDCPPAHAMTL